MTVGSLLKQWREAASMTQVVLAIASGVSQPYISEIENDRHRPLPDTAIKLAQALGKDWRLFFDPEKLNVENAS